MCQMALVPLAAGKRLVTWRHLFDMTDILSAYVSSAMAEIASVSDSSRELCIALPVGAGHVVLTAGQEQHGGVHARVLS